ncbi:U2 snRNP complex subunit [Saccharomycopsis crataegensis]|uniref:U2 snRNP complex subunit n=1 Tax=Saccharomycopsis crataegensis TaxID=43959 RepID=A0AAV5QLV3_9ASCO|nr:U2 snRNP complex subunit [Saccharomycopsis crataegensis]
MPKIKTKRTKAAPEGFDNIKSQLDKYEAELKDIEASKLTKTSNKNEHSWAVLRVHHQRSRYIYELYYKKKIISNDLYQWLLKQKYADAGLIAKWKKQGYEKLCCLRCLEKKCVCRVPKNEEKVRCINCGCYGCASGG